MNEFVKGTDANDDITTGSGNDRVEAGKGDDSVTLGLGDDTAFGGSGQDTLIGDTSDASVANGENLIVNGSFEEIGAHGKTGWGKIAKLDGWDVEGTWSQLPNNGYLGVTASDGEHWVDMANEGPGTDVKMSQTINGLSEGAAFQLSMDAALQSPAFPSHVKVFWNGIQVGTLDPQTRDMQTFSFTVIAGAGDGTDTVQLIGHSEKGYVGIALDNVQLHATAAVDGGDDRLEGGLGSDDIRGQGGDDLLAGQGAGNEWQLVDGKWVYDASKVTASGDGTASIDASGDVLKGGDGDDVLLGKAGNDNLSGGGGNDRINAGDGDDAAFGGDGDDTINLEDGDDTAEGGLGDDVINAGDGNDVIYGDVAGSEDEGGDDNLRGGAGDDEIHGNAGNDSLHGGTGADALFGGLGDDVINAGSEDDHAAGGDGADKIRGEAGNDDLSGNDGKDYLDGGSGNDLLDGGAGADRLVGGTGSDTLIGGEGDDHMWGGNWKGDQFADTFVVKAGGGKDFIHDFEAAHDQIDLSAYGLEFDDVKAVTSDQGWATTIDLSQLDGGQLGDKLILKSVNANDLDESNFIL